MTKKPYITTDIIKGSPLPPKVYSSAGDLAKGSTAFSSSWSYLSMLPENLNILSGVGESVSLLTDKNVKKNTIDVLAIFSNYLSSVRLKNDKSVTNYLSRLHISEQENLSVVIEWNFSNFRIGFLVEPNIDDLSYFLVSDSREENSFFASTKRIGKKYPAAIEEIMHYVLRST